MSDGSPSSTSIHQGPARPAGRRKRPVLVCAYPGALAVALPDSGEVVGRAWLASRGLADSEVSGKHLRFDRAGGAVRVVDVGSRNGTWLDGTRLDKDEAVPLEDGGVLRMGKTLFVFRERLEGPLEPAAPLGELVGPFGLRDLNATVDALSRSATANVLIQGATGVGKELTARAVAAAMGRAEPFAAVNVAGVAAGVFDSQMFGHVAGAFSGAGTASAGIARTHDGGTLFLDEIGELDLPLQAKLLRLLDNREVLPVGANEPSAVDVLVVAATNRDLDGMVEAGTFRRDLHARLAMACIDLPTLHERSEDLFHIGAAVAARAGATLATGDVEVEAMERLLLHRWPSNIRELDAVLAATRRRDPAPGLRLWALEEVLGAAPAPRGALTRDAVEAAIADAGGNVSAAAKNLGVSRGKLLRLRKK